MKHRTTSDHITKLEPRQIFVFGSNIGGRHGKGAAKLAVQKFGAKYGIGEGLHGSSYALPTVNHSITAPLPLDRIAGHIQTFIQCAKENPHLTFLVTEVGCGLAGLSYKDIGPMFRDAIELENVHLPAKFWRTLQH